ncbi:MAG TPA: methyltransferase domain-containing protein [Candidatus Sulfotelmatobacter sp.]|nr:methyltransferase domain-containing protein [Candidatus Sulfotelmatobacter sp.]
MAGNPQTYSAPFDAVAPGYDQLFTSSAIGQAQRIAVWRHLEKAFYPGDRVLEIGCGTGVDACFLAKSGVRVVACDSSSRMIEVATRRIQDGGLEELVQAVVLPAEEVESLATEAAFDGAFSNFGVLNCIEDIASLAAGLGRLLKPGAKLVLCYMGERCLWEVAWYLACGNPGKAFRRFRRGTTAQVSGGTPLKVRYPSVREVRGAFEPYFELKYVKGIGVLVPPSYLERRANQFPRLLHAASVADSRLETCPGIRRLADHILLQFERRAA